MYFRKRKGGEGRGKGERFLSIPISVRKGQGQRELAGGKQRPSWVSRCHISSVSQMWRTRWQLKGARSWENGTEKR